MYDYDLDRFRPAALHAQGVATDRLIDSIIVTGERDRARIATPNTAASQTAEDLRTQNLVNPEDALRYVPNLTIRKRYIGDRNALIGGRSFSTLQAPRGLVFMDGYLISNFLGRFDAPRWNMIAPEEIERIDVLYGPFSAIYPGNSIGTTVVVTTRKPQDLELGRAHDRLCRELRRVWPGGSLLGLSALRLCRRSPRERRLVVARPQSTGCGESSDAVLHRVRECGGPVPACAGRRFGDVRHRRGL